MEPLKEITLVFDIENNSIRGMHLYDKKVDPDDPTIGFLQLGFEEIVTIEMPSEDRTTWKAKRIEYKKKPVPINTVIN